MPARPKRTNRVSVQVALRVVFATNDDYQLLRVTPLWLTMCLFIRGLSALVLCWIPMLRYSSAATYWLRVRLHKLTSRPSPTRLVHLILVVVLEFLLRDARMPALARCSMHCAHATAPRACFSHPARTQNRPRVATSRASAFDASSATMSWAAREACIWICSVRIIPGQGPT